MFLVDKKLQKTKLTISLLAVLHSHTLRAEAILQAEPPLASTQIPLTTTADALQEQPGVSMVWPLLPGDSINSLAVLFYPKNKTMQQRFITKTLQLNQASRLEPATRANLVGLILIPDIKSLGKHSGRIHAHTSHSAKNDHSHQSNLHLSYNLKDAKDFVVTEKMQQDYDDLVKRDARIKAELQALNDKQAQLEQILAGLRAQVALNRDALVPEAANHQANTKLDEAKQALTVPEAGQVHMASKITAPSNFPGVNPVANNPGQAKSDPLYLWGLGILLLALSALVIVWRNFSRRQAKNLYLAATGEFDPLKTSIFNPLNEITGHQTDNLQKLDFSLTQNGLSEGMSVVDLTNVEGMDYTEESELILEQARIYVNIGRVDEATELLKAQIKTMPKASLHHLLYLLDIYRDYQRKTEFLQYAKQLHETFNVMTPLWDNAAVPIVMASSLEEFAHIMQKLTTLWANPEPLIEAKAYIDELITDNRDSERAGFSMEVFQELVLLRDLLIVREKIATSD